MKLRSELLKQLSEMRSEFFSKVNPLKDTIAQLGAALAGSNTAISKLNEKLAKEKQEKR